MSWLWGKAGRRAGKLGFRRDERGATAIEFAMVLTPFLVIGLAVVDLGLIYYASSQIESAVFAAEEEIKDPKTRPTSASAVKTKICQMGAPVIKCERQGFYVEVSPLTATSPAGTDPKSNSFSVTPDQPAIIRVIYPWDNLLPLSALNFIGLKVPEIKVRVNVFFHVPA